MNEGECMKLPTSIENILNENIVECERVEFKGNWNPEPILHSICAFANDINNWGGGYILVGIEDDNGRPKYPIKGIETASIDKIQKEILAKCKMIRPSYTPIVDVTQYKGKNIIVIWCYGGLTRPYKCPTTLDKDFSKGYSYYIRTTSSTIKANENQQKELYDLARTIPFDDMMNHEAEIRDLKLPLIQNYLYEIKSDLLKESEKMDFIDLCKSMRIVDGTTEYMKPLNVGLMFFNDEPQKFFPYSQIEVVDLRNGPEGDKMTERIFKGPIDSMTRSALTYIRNTVIEERILKIEGQAEAVRYFNYPYQAIEEALVNAVYHRGYDIREPVEVRIMEDRIHIVSYPGPDRSISEKSIEDKNMIARKYRNRRIGELLKELKLTEGRNTGIPKIKRALKNNGSKEPEFETNEDRDYFITTIFMHEGFENKKLNKNDVINEVINGVIKFGENEIKVLNLIKENSYITKKEICKNTGLSKSTTDRVISNLKEKDAIKRIGANKNGYWKIIIDIFN